MGKEKLRVLTQQQLVKEFAHKQETAEKFLQILLALQNIVPKVNDVTVTAQEMDASSTATSLVTHAQTTAASAEEVTASTEEVHASMKDALSLDQSK